MRIVLTLALAATLLSCPAFAHEAADPVANGASPAQIRTEQADLRTAIEHKAGNYAHFSDEERAAIFAKQDEVVRLVQGKETLTDLGPDGRLALANALEEVKALVTRAEDARMICERIKPVGSNRPQNKCMSVGERRRQRDRLRQEGVNASK